MAYFFCRGDNETRRTPELILSSLAWQILRNWSDDKLLMASFEKFRTQLQRDDHATLQQVIDLLEFLLEAGSACRIMLDSLDELEQSAQDSIYKALSKLKTKCLIMISSRDQGTIRRSLQNLTRSVPIELVELQLSMNDNKQDIMLYVSDRVQELDLDQQSRLDVATRLSLKSEGMFQYAKTMISYLSGFDPMEILETLEKIPTGLYELYNRVFRRIYDPGIVHEYRQETVEQAILWILWAGRDLSFQELSIGVFMLRTKGPKDNVDDRLDNFRRSLSEVCGSMFKYGNEEETIAFCHFSVREYLLSDTCPFPIFRNGIEANDQLAHACLVYTTSEHLDLVEVSRDWKKSKEAFEEHRSKHAFLEYATVFWWYHAFDACNSRTARVQNLFKSLVSSERQMVLWIQNFHHFYWRESSKASVISESIKKRFPRPSRVDGQYRIPNAEMPEEDLWNHHLGWVIGARATRWGALFYDGDIYCLPIHLAAHFNFTKLISSLLMENPEQLEVAIRRENTPLHAAAKAHALDTLNMLIAEHAAVNPKNHLSYETALAVWLIPGELEGPAAGPNLVTLGLLEAGADPNCGHFPTRNVWHYFGHQSNES